MAYQAVSELMDGAMDRIQAMVDSNTVIGTPITTPDGATLIPVSRLTFAFASGGSDKTASAAKPGIWGGSGAAVKVEPIGFVLGRDGGARMLCIQPPAFTTADRLLDMVPEVLERVESYLAKGEKRQSSRG